MVYIQDSTQSFTISLTALLEGKGIIISMQVTNNTQGTSYFWDGVSWSPSMPHAVEADSMTLEMEVQNQGDASDDLFVEFDSAQVTPANPLQEWMADVGYVFMPLWNFTMPPNAVNITINAGHVE